MVPVAIAPSTLCAGDLNVGFKKKGLKSMANIFTKIAAKAKSEVTYYRMLIQHPEVPLLAKLFLWLAVFYLLLPFDLIPDFIPIIGQIDDLIIVPLLIIIGLMLIPEELKKKKT